MMVYRTSPVKVEKINPVIAIVYADPEEICSIAFDYAFAGGEGLLFIETETLRILLENEGHYDAEEINKVLELVPPDTDYVEFVW